MKKALLLLFTVVLMVSLKAQQTHDHSDPNHKHEDNGLVAKQSEHDFGKIPQGKPVYYEFEVLNEGNAPLKINNVTATCGCTTPEWSKEPIPAGQTGKIKVGYNSAAEGYFEKFITIMYGENQTKQLKIKGTVWKAPIGVAPSNASVQFLKQQIQ